MAMLAARSSGGGVSGPGVGGHPPPHVHRRQSVASLGGTKAQRSNSQDGKRGTSNVVATPGKQGVLQQQQNQRSRTMLLREMETSWYLKMFGLGKEDTVTQQTGMPYRSVLELHGNAHN